MRQNKIKIDFTVKMDGVRLAKGKDLNMVDAIKKINAVADKKINGVVNKQLFGGIVTSIACFGLFYMQVVSIMA